MRPVIALALLSACHQRGTSSEVSPTLHRTAADSSDASLSPAEMETFAKALAAALPERLGAFHAHEHAGESVRGQTVEASRTYASSDKRELTLTVHAGDVTPYRSIVASSGEHAFGSDSFTYWGDGSIKGRRGRFSYQTKAPFVGEVWVALGSREIVSLRVFPLRSHDESVKLMSLLDLDAIAKTQP
jgi:hypothetical protein